MSPPILPLLPLSHLTRRSPRRVATEGAIRGAAQAVPMGDGTVLGRVLGRYKMLVDSRDLGHAPHLLLDGFWAWWTTVFVAGALRAGETFVDGGAAYGYFSLPAAELVGAAGRVIAIEPNPRLAGLLRRNLALGGVGARVRVEEAALVGARSAAMVRLRAPSHDPAGSHVAGGDLVGRDPDVEEEAFAPDEIAVPGVRLSALGITGPALIKLDIGGAEWTVWDDLAGLLAAGRGVRAVLAFDAGACPSPGAFLRSIAAAGALRRIDPDGRPRATSEAELLGGGGGAMLLVGAG